MFGCKVKTRKVNGGVPIVFEYKTHILQSGNLLWDEIIDAGSRYVQTLK